MLKSENVNGRSRWSQTVLALATKVIAALGLLALGFLLTRAAATTFPIGWILFVVAIIEVSLSCSPTRGTSSTERAFPEQSTNCRAYPSRARTPYYCRRPNRNDVSGG